MQKLLVVEDDTDIQELLQNFLQDAGYQVVLADDGIEAVDTFAKEQFDLVFFKPWYKLGSGEVCLLVI